MTIAVIGVGLIGGSIGLAARERLGATVQGFDAGDGVLDAALGRGAVDRACASPAEAVEGAETVFVAVPVGAVPGAVGEALAAAGEDVRRHGRGLDQARRRRRPRGPALRRRPPADRRGDRRRRARARRPVRGRHLVLDADGDDVGDALRAPAPHDRRARRPPGRDRRRHARPPAGQRLAPAARARQRARLAGRGHPGRTRTSACPPPGRASATPPASPAPTGRYGRISICQTAMPWSSSSTKPLARLAGVRDALVAGGRATASRPGTSAPPTTGGRCSRPASPAARCTSCGCRCRTARAWWRRSRSSWAALASTSPTWPCIPPTDMREGVVALWIAGDEPAARAAERAAALGFPVARA